MSTPFDLVILGSGFGGTLLAMAARRAGRSVLLLERGAHPRFAMGESSSPLANLLLEELAHEYDLPRLLPLAQYGPWKRAYPEVTVGLKRGFTYYHHQPGREHRPDRETQLLVAASPNDELSDTHWYRADFDHFLLRGALALGVEYLDRFQVEGCDPGPESVEVRGTREGRSHALRARFVVDATGPRGALSRLLALPEEAFPGYPATAALYSHFTDVPRFAEQLPDLGGEPPFPPDDSALHHVFPGGWMWVLRFENGITSAGFAVEEWLARDLRLEEKEAAWRRFLERFPSIGRQFAGAVPVLPWMHAPRLSYRAGVACGERWALLPAAAAFVDPLFSTGFPLNLLGIRRLARAVRDDWSTPRFPEAVAAAGAVSRREAATAARLVAACYRAFSRFPDFAARTMFYFAAASYSEMARRLERADLAAEFLLGHRPEFQAALARHSGDDPSTLEAVGREIEPFNIAGLCDPAKRNWYGVELEDTIREAARLETTPDAVRAFFYRMGWA